MAGGRGVIGKYLCKDKEFREWRICLGNSMWIEISKL